MIIDTTQTRIERAMDHRRAFPIREDCTVLGGQPFGHPFTVLWTSDPYPTEVGLIFINDYKITYLEKSDDN